MGGRAAHRRVLDAIFKEGPPSQSVPMVAPTAKKQTADVQANQDGFIAIAPLRPPIAVDVRPDVHGRWERKTSAE
jgi:hypothetical protein